MVHVASGVAEDALAVEREMIDVVIVGLGGMEVFGIEVVAMVCEESIDLSCCSG